MKAIAKSAPSVKRVVVTSSFAAILDEALLGDGNTTFSEASWNPVGLENIHDSPAVAYRVSKKLAEKAAWDFVKDPANGAKFDVVTVNPPLVLGPVVHHLATLDSINTSNERVVAAVTGKWKEGVPATGAALIWVDVRDVARAHIRAGLELPEAGGKRLLTTAGFFSNRDILKVLRKNFPEFANQLPGDEVKGGEFPPEDQHYKVNNAETNRVLGIDWIPLEKSVVDTVKSLKSFVS